MVVLWHVDPKTGALLERVPPMIVLAVHKKSMRSTQNDYLSEKKATAESLVLQKILFAINSAFPNSSVLMGGDFNRFIPNDPTLQPIFKNTHVRDAFQYLFDRKPELADKTFRTTHYYFEKSGARSFHQLDAWMLNSKASQVVDYSHPNPVWVPRWRRVENGELTDVEIPDPSSFGERNQELPSDHNPVLIHLDLQPYYPQLILP